MKWEIKKAQKGDIVRVKVKFYYHYGIFVNENEIIQFGLPDNSGVDPDTIEVISTDIETFLNGSCLETGVYEREEKRKSKSREEIVACAKEKLGTRGYNILHNNCEHFVNQCVFNESKSNFLEKARSEIRKKLKRPD